MFFSEEFSQLRCGVHQDGSEWQYNCHAKRSPKVERQEKKIVTMTASPTLKWSWRTKQIKGKGITNCGLQNRRCNLHLSVILCYLHCVIILGNTGLWNWIEFSEAMWLLRLAETTPPPPPLPPNHSNKNCILSPLANPRPLPTHLKEALKRPLAILPHLSIFCYATIPFTLLWRKNPHKRDGARGPPT